MVLPKASYTALSNCSLRRTTHCFQLRNARAGCWFTTLAAHVLAGSPALVGIAAPSSCKAVRCACACIMPAALQAASSLRRLKAVVRGHRQWPQETKDGALFCRQWDSANIYGCIWLGMGAAFGGARKLARRIAR